MTDPGSARSQVKVLFDIEDDDGISVESLWATQEDAGFRLDNIPFYAAEVALDDVVAVVVDRDGGLRFSGLIKASGHSTVRLWFGRSSDVSDVRARLRGLGCPSELDLDRLLAVDVPPYVSYCVVRSYLDSLEAAGVLEYEEGCVAQ
jgi:hypothetical protein